MKYNVKMKAYLLDDTEKEYEREIEADNAAKAMELMRADVEANHSELEPEDIEVVSCYVVRD